MRSSKTMRIILVLVVCLPGCSTQKDKHLLSILQDEQTSKHTVIGSLVEPYFEFVDLQKGMNVKFISSSRIDFQRDANGLRPNNGRVASCTDNQCLIADSMKNSTTFLFKNDHIVTPLYWSPDGRLLLFVRDMASIRFPVRCGFDEEHDVVIYEPATGKELIVRTVCGGYPYKQLGWYVAHDQIPHP